MAAGEPGAAEGERKGEKGKGNGKNGEEAQMPGQRDVFDYDASRANEIGVAFLGL